MKQFDIKSERVLGENLYFVRPFPAFVSANLSGELSTIVIPILSSVLPLVGGKDNLDNLLDIDVEVAAPALASGLSSLSGDKIEGLLKKLLVKYKNISVQLEGENEAQLLTEDMANDLFCGDAQDLFILAFDVIKANFSGFFKKLGGQFGSLLKGLQKG